MIARNYPINSAELARRMDRADKGFVERTLRPWLLAQGCPKTVDDYPRAPFVIDEQLARGAAERFGTALP